MLSESFVIYIMNVSPVHAEKLFGFKNAGSTGIIYVILPKFVNVTNY